MTGEAREDAERRIAYFEASRQIARREGVFFAASLGGAILFFRLDAEGTFYTYHLFVIVLFVTSSYGALMVAFVASHHLIQIDRLRRFAAFGSLNDEKYGSAYPGTRKALQKVGFVRRFQTLFLGEPTSVHVLLKDFERTIATYQRRIYWAKLTAVVTIGLGAIFFLCAKFGASGSDEAAQQTIFCEEMIETLRGVSTTSEADVKKIEALCEKKVMSP